MQVRRFTADWRAALALGLGRLVEEAEIPAEDPAEIPSGNPVEVTAEMQTGSERPPEAEGTAGGEGESQGAHVANGKGDEREAEESAEATAKDTAPGSQTQKDANSSAPAAATPSTPTAKVEQAAGADGLAVADNGTRAPEPPVSDVISVAVLDLGEILLKYTHPSLPPVYLPSTSHPPCPFASLQDPATMVLVGTARYHRLLALAYMHYSEASYAGGRLVELGPAGWTAICRDAQLKLSHSKLKALFTARQGPRGTLSRVGFLLVLVDVAIDKCVALTHSPFTASSSTMACACCGCRGTHALLPSMPRPVRTRQVCAHAGMRRGERWCQKAPGTADSAADRPVVAGAR